MNTPKGKISLSLFTTYLLAAVALTALPMAALAQSAQVMNETFAGDGATRTPPDTKTAKI